jgi:TPP-dependent pyruvate/acetoin dehydrogenase alpha subunit
VKSIEDWATSEVAAAVQFAEESAPPEAEELWRDIVAEHGPTRENE